MPKHNPAERYVYRQLKKEGKKPKWAQTGKGYDIRTKDRLIEVKGKEKYRILEGLETRVRYGLNAKLVRSFAKKQGIEIKVKKMP